MRTSSRLGRTLVLTCSAGLVSVLAMVPSGSAFALVSGNFVTGGDATSNPTSGNTCDVVSGSDSSTSPTKALVGGKLTAKSHLSVTFQSSTDTSDTTTVTGHYTGVAIAKKSHGDLSQLTLNGTGALTIQRAEGSASHCKTTADMASEIEPLSFTESHDGWLVYHHSATAKAQLLELEVENSTGVGGAIVDVTEGGASSADGRAFAKAGTYEALAIVAIISDGILLKSAPHTDLTLSFFKAGAAPSGTSGSGKSFVRFPGAISCSGHSAKLTFTGKAGQVASAKFSVNGHKAGSVSNPKAGHKVVLRHLGKTADNKITASLSLKGGGSATATRSYLPCAS